MKTRRVVIAFELVLGLLFAGAGHYFVALWRAVYPLDGFFFYGLAVVCFIAAWRTLRSEQNPVWDAALNLGRGAWHELTTVARETLHNLRQALPYISLRVMLLVAITINLAAGLAAYFLPSLTWLWGLAWCLTIIAAIILLWPRSLSLRSGRTGVTAARTYYEPAILPGARVNPAGLALSIGLLLLGQGLMLVSNNAKDTAPIAQMLEEAFQLRLPVESWLIWPGVGILLGGTVLFAVVTRRAALNDYPPLSVTEARAHHRPRLGLLLVALAGIIIWVLALRSIATGEVGQISAWLWFLAAAVIGACWWQIDRGRGVRLSLHLHRREAILLAMALIVMLAIFAFQIGQIPNSLWGDEGAFYTQARDAAQGVSVPDVFGLGTYAEPAFTTLFASWIISLLGPTVSAWRFSSVLAVWLAALPLYFLVRATLGKRTAWVALAFYAVSPWVLTYARMGYDSAQAIWPVVLALALTWLAVQRDSRFYAFLAGCAAGLSFFTPMSARIVLVLVPVWLIWIWLSCRVSARIIGWQLLTVLLGMLITAAPANVYGLSHDRDAYVGKQFESAFNNVFYARDFYPEEQLFEWYDPIPAGQQQLFYSPEFYAPLIGRGVIRTALAFHLSAVVRENYLVGSLSDPFGVLYLLGLAWCAARFRRPGYAIWPVWLLLGGFLTSALSAFPPRAALLLPTAPALVVLAALGVTAVTDVITVLIGRVSERSESYALIGATALLAMAGLRLYFIEMPQRFPPDLENAIFWQAQQLPREGDIVLIQPDDVPENFVPWGISQFNTGIKWHLLKKADLPSADWNTLCPNVCRVFVSAADRDIAQPIMAQAFAGRTPDEIRNADGLVQAYVYAR